MNREDMLLDLERVSRYFRECAEGYSFSNKGVAGQIREMYTKWAETVEMAASELRGASDAGQGDGNQGT